MLLFCIEKIESVNNFFKNTLGYDISSVKKINGLF